LIKEDALSAGRWFSLVIGFISSCDQILTTNLICSFEIFCIASPKATLKTPSLPCCNHTSGIRKPVDSHNVLLSLLYFSKYHVHPFKNSDFHKYVHLQEYDKTKKPSPIISLTRRIKRIDLDIINKNINIFHELLLARLF
jgi:hypothetical protein